MDFERRLEEGPLRVQTLWSADQTERLPQRVLKARRSRALATAFAVSVLAVVSAAVSWRASGPPTQLGGPAPQPIANWSTGSATAREFRLSDGTQVRLLSRDSKLEMEEESAQRLRAHLRSGSARFDVSHDPSRVFEVESGGVEVRVVGTAFTLTREGPLTRVFVERGSVQVVWLKGQALLAAGQMGLYPPPSSGSEVLAPADASAKPTAAVEASAEASAPEPGSWRKLAKRGEYADAFRAIGPSSAKLVRDDPSDLMLAADVARLSRHPSEALRFLSRVSDGFPQDPRAPLAAFTLGRVLLEDLGQPGRAADAFRRAQQLAPAGPLASDALAREALAAERAGEAERAKLVARRYLERFPRGAHADRLRKL
jgi:transmembrane sensor